MVGYTPFFVHPICYEYPMLPVLGSLLVPYLISSVHSPISLYPSLHRRPTVRSVSVSLSVSLSSSSTVDTKRPKKHGSVPGRPTWQQTMLRIADPVKSLAFYRDTMGMTLIDTLDFPQYDFKLYFLVTLPEGEVYDLTPGTQEAHVSLVWFGRSMVELSVGWPVGGVRMFVI